MWIFGAAGGAAILKLTCPHCKQPGVYAREAVEVSLACKHCGKYFVRSDVEGGPTRASVPPR